MKISILLILFLPFFFSVTCKYYTYQTTALLIEIIPFCSELRVSYDRRATPSHAIILYTGCGMYSQGTLRLLNACVTDRDEYARN